jgi:hypothetical protein
MISCMNTLTAGIRGHVYQAHSYMCDAKISTAHENTTHGYVAIIEGIIIVWRRF